MRETPKLEELLGHEDWLRRLLARLCHDLSLVDDVVQETWLSALKSAPPRSESSRSWLARVAQNGLRKILRSQSRRTKREESFSGPEASIPLDRALECVAFQRRLAGLVLELPESHRSAIILRFYENLPPREIARMSETSIETVKSRIKRGLARLRDSLDKADLQDFERRHRFPFSILPLPWLRRTGVFQRTMGHILAPKMSAAVLAVTLVSLLAFVSLPLDESREFPSVPQKTQQPTVSKTSSAKGLVASTAGWSAHSGAATRIPIQAGWRRDLIKGQVLNLSGQPIPRASVICETSVPMFTKAFSTLPPQELLADTTDEEGRFSIRVPPSTAMCLVVEHELHAPSFRSEVFGGANLEITLGEVTTVLVHVEDENGDPIEGVSIRPYFSFHSTALEEGKTDSEGLARMDCIPVGTRTTLIFEAKGFGDSRGAVEPSRELTTSLKKTLKRGVEVTGTILDSRTGEAVKNAEVRGNFSEVVVSDTDGHFRLTTLPDEKNIAFMIAVRAKGFGEYFKKYLGRDLFASKHITIELDPEVKVSGSVVREDGRPVEGARVAYVTNMYDAGTSMDHEDEVVTDDAGRFQLSGIRRKSHENDMSYSVLVRRVRLGMKADIVGPFTGSGPIELEPYVLTKSGSIRGTANLEALADPGTAVIQLMVHGRGRSLYANQVDAVPLLAVVPDKTGAFFFDGLAGGTYRVQLAGVQGNVWNPPPILMATLDLGDGEDKEDVVLTSPRVLTGNVQWTGAYEEDEGNDLLFLQVTAYRESTPEVPVVRGRVRQDATFELFVDQEGLYRLDVTEEDRTLGSLGNVPTGKAVVIPIQGPEDIRDR